MSASGSLILSAAYNASGTPNSSKRKIAPRRAACQPNFLPENSVVIATDTSAINRRRFFHFYCSFRDNPFERSPRSFMLTECETMSRSIQPEPIKRRPVRDVSLLVPSDRTTDQHARKALPLSREPAQVQHERAPSRARPSRRGALVRGRRHALRRLRHGCGEDAPEQCYRAQPSFEAITTSIAVNSDP